MIGRRSINQNSESGVSTYSEGDTNVTVVEGLATHEDIKIYTMGVVYSMLPELKKTAEDSSKPHVEKYINEIIEESGLSSVIDSLKDPEKLTVFIDSVYSIAKRTNKIDDQTLKALLIKKIKNNDEESDEIGLVLNKALETTAELTKSQIVFLAFVYSLKHLTLFFNGVQVNFINRRLPIDSESQSSILIEGKVISIAEIRETYSHFYETIFNKTYLNSEIKALIKPVDKYYLEYARCISINAPTSNFMVSDHTISNGFKINTGIDFHSELGLTTFKALHFILEKFGIEHIDQINQISLSPIGIAIAESFIENETGFTIVK